jgi:hypothetical protein
VRWTDGGQLAWLVLTVPDEDVPLDAVADDPVVVEDPVVVADVEDTRVVEPLAVDFEASVATTAAVVLDGAEAAMAPHTPTKPAMLTPAAVSRARRAGWRRRVRRFGGTCRSGADGMGKFSLWSLRRSCGQAWIPLGSRRSEDRPQGSDG